MGQTEMSLKSRLGQFTLLFDADIRDKGDFTVKTIEMVNLSTGHIFSYTEDHTRQEKMCHIIDKRHFLLRSADDFLCLFIHVTSLWEGYQFAFRVQRDNVISTVVHLYETANEPLYEEEPSLRWTTSSHRGRCETTKKLVELLETLPLEEARKFLSTYLAVRESQLENV